MSDTPKSEQIVRHAPRCVCWHLKHQHDERAPLPCAVDGCACEVFRDERSYAPNRMLFAPAGATPVPTKTEYILNPDGSPKAPWRDV